VIFIDKTDNKMADNFNLTSFLKKNQLLNENIGGYVDMIPVKEEMGTVIGEDDTQNIRTTGGDKLLAIAQFLYDKGYGLEDMIDFLQKNLKFHKGQ